MRRIVSTYFLALGFAVVVSAQEPAPRPEGASPRPAPVDAPSAPALGQETPRPAGTAGQTPAADAKPIMIVGCVAGGPAAFTLTNAAAAGSTDKDKPGAVGTAGISSSYDLTARPGVDLASHVGHKVEVTGTPAPAAGPGAAPAPGAAGSKPPAAKLTVTAVKMMSASCP